MFYLSAWQSRINRVLASVKSSYYNFKIQLDVFILLFFQLAGFNLRPIGDDARMNIKQVGVYTKVIRDRGSTRSASARCQGGNRFESRHRVMN